MKPKTLRSWLRCEQLEDRITPATPTAVDDTVTTNEDEVAHIYYLTYNDSDPDLNTHSTLSVSRMARTGRRRWKRTGPSRIRPTCMARQ
jgi:hypothetical protein